MFTVGQEVSTRYGVATVVCIGSVKPMLYVRLHGSSEVYVLDHSQVDQPNQPEMNPREVTAQPAGSQDGRRAGQSHPNADAATDLLMDCWRSQMKHRRLNEPTPLAVFVQNRLAELGMKQSEFCRLTGFDQGLLSKIQSSMITNLSLETALRLAVGLNVPPEAILTLIDRADLHALITQAYPGSAGPAPPAGEEVPPPVREINRLAMRAHELGRSLSPVIGVLAHMALMRGDNTNCLVMEASAES